MFALSHAACIARAILSALSALLHLSTRQPFLCLYHACVLTSLPFWSPAFPPWVLPFSSILAEPTFTAIIYPSIHSPIPAINSVY